MGVVGKGVGVVLVLYALASFVYIGEFAPALFTLIPGAEGIASFVFNPVAYFQLVSMAGWMYYAVFVLYPLIWGVIGAVLIIFV